MPTNDTLKTFKNSQANVLIRQEEFFSEQKDLSQVYAEDIAVRKAEELNEDESFNSNEILKNLKDILVSKINGDSNFLKESEIDALEVKTPAAIKQHKLKRKERKTRKKNYKAELKLIQQLEAKNDINYMEVKEVEKRLLALEGYEYNAELNALTDIKYQFLAKKFNNIVYPNPEVNLIQYYMEHSRLKDIYANYNYKTYDENFNNDLRIYETNSQNIAKLSYSLNYTTAGSIESLETLNDLRKNYKMIIEAGPKCDKRMRLMLLQRDLTQTLNKLYGNYSSIMRTKVNRRQILGIYSKELANNQQEKYNESMFDEFFKYNKTYIFENMQEAFSSYATSILNKVHEYEHANKLSKIEKDETTMLCNKLEQYISYYIYKTKDFDELFVLIESFDKDITVEAQNKFNNSDYTSMSNAIRRIGKVEAEKLSDILKKIESTTINDGVNEPYKMKSQNINIETLRLYIKEGKQPTTESEIRKLRLSYPDFIR